MRLFAFDVEGTAYHNREGELVSGDVSQRALQKRPEVKVAAFVRMDINLETLANLLSKRLLKVEDLHGMDQQTKQYIRRLLLSNLISS